MSYRDSLSKAPRMMPKAPHLSGLLLSLIVALGLLALACQPAQPPTAAPQAAATQAAPTVAPEATAVAAALANPLVAPTMGKYVERAGLRILIPDGFEFGGAIIPADPRPPRYGGIGVGSHPGDPPSLDPYHTTSYLMNRTSATTYDGLVRFNEKAGVDPYNNPMIGGLAESWEVSDDFLTYTFHLRKGVKFHNLPPVNGREFDAEDVKATLALYMDPGSIIKSSYVAVDRVEVIDRYTVAFRMKEVEIQLLTTLAESARGAILPREMADPASTARRGGGIGTGPFMVQNEYQYKVGITYRRNPDYWLFDEGNRLPYLDGRRVVVIPDNSASLTAFRTGKVDWGVAVPGGVPGLRAFMAARPNTLVHESVSAGGTGGCYCLRLDKAPWNDVRVRRALSMAIDYETTGQTLNGQPALDLSGVISGLWHGSDNRLTTVAKDCGCPWYTYDPKRAKELLAEAGFPKGFSTTLAFFPYGQQQIENTELYAAYWKAIGVDAKILSQDYTVYRANVDSGGWENIGYSFLCCGSYTVYSSMGALRLGGPKNPQMGFINDPKIAGLAKEISASYRDEAKQRDLLGQARAYYLDQVFTIPLPTGTGKTVFAPRLRNFTTTNHVPTIHEVRGWMWTWIDDDWAFNK